MYNVNVNPTTGIRYGVIATHSLNSDVEEELFYGGDAANLSYEEAYAEAKTEAESKHTALLDEATIAANETDGNMPEGDFDRFIEAWFETRGLEYDEEMFVDRELEQFSDCCQIDEPSIEGVYEGVKYRIGWLGGAPLLWVFEGPVGYANTLCSPCVPNAADLDSGWDDTDDGGHLCYVVPRDWMRAEK